MAKKLNAASEMLMGKPQKVVEVPSNVKMVPAVEYKTERTQIVLRKSTKKALKTIAKRETDGSLNELISRICEDYIAKYNG